ncbi:Nif3-like dinuclear metal center hexameric protein [Rhodoluna sp.]|uniref:Nif3-like dinuclear metal center hexameric protein n=1 Tax=Rhodoluna sp. TaxID=1969481 RepID=UPI0025D86891|nr:Nif3-like dinuclear metal center hexameric protein [Rhodoluna sp.]
MSVELSQLIASFEKAWPIELAETWDAPGLIAGSANQRVARVLLTVDVTAEILAEAQDGAFDLILAHHPYLMRGITTVNEQTAKGALLASAARSNTAIYAAHTNADVVSDGVSAALAAAIGITTARPLVASTDQSIGHGRIGDLAAPMTLGDFARQVANVLPSTATGVRVAGEYDQIVSCIALCGGAGDSFIADAIASGADVYLSSDLRHHPAQDAREHAQLHNSKPALVDVSHWAGEWMWLEVAAARLAKEFSEVQFVVSHIRTDPWDFVVTQ